MSVSNPKCPFCNAEMIAGTPFFDKYSGKYSSYAKCWGCGAHGPIAKGNTTEVTTNRAKKYALNRPKQKPLRWPVIEAMHVVWLEDVDKRDVLPAFPEPVTDKDVMCFLTYDQEFITAGKADYGRRWRAWASQPTAKERKETAWTKA